MLVQLTEINALNIQFLNMKTLIIILLISFKSFAQDLGTKLPKKSSNAVEILEKTIKKSCEKLETKKDTIRLEALIKAYQKLSKKEKKFCLKTKNQDS